ncbi:MAG TPA: hypothetical protein VN258_08605 [Mobilitalea sp.]|nr:hypothetical protein [Mobilitalea sp.]
MMLLTWLVIGFGIYYFIKHSNSSNSQTVNPKTPEVILKERYVNSEIDEATYERMKNTIRN